MSTFKKCKVVMLPTNQKAEIGTKNWYFKGTQALIINEFVSNLYILSDDEIKEGDWMYNEEREPSVLQCIGKGSLRGWKKIIATTDKSLCDGKCAKNECVCVFPQPSEGFIEKYVEEYNKGNVVTEVMVEYNHGTGVFKNFCDILKVNPKDNTITIRAVKDSWSREEVIALCKKCYDQIDMDESEYDLNTWIEENL